MHNILEIKEIHDLPITTLIYRAQEVHHKYQQPDKVLLTAAKSVKTGGCPEDCAFCPQSAHYQTLTKRSKGIMSKEEVLEYARESQAKGAKRLCLGAPWGKAPAAGLSQIADYIRDIQAMGLEVCLSVGTLDEGQMEEILEAGCNVVNYNLDTSREYYDKVITTRSYDERHKTLKLLQEKGLRVCCGGILGMGESKEDRLRLLESLVNLEPQPESVPVNWLVSIKGTPLGETKNILQPIDYVRFIATARILMPKTYIAMAAGRVNMSEEMQTLCFLAGANSFIIGDKILTTGNPSIKKDAQMVSNLGLIVDNGLRTVY